MQPYLKKSELEIRKIYKLNSRNLLIGVWNGFKFVGIRKKFDSEYLDSEYHWDETGATPYDKNPNQSYGTAKPTKKLEILLPKEIKANESSKTIDRITKRKITWIEDKGWCFLDTGLFWKKIRPYGKPNKKLFNFLKLIEIKMRPEFRADLEKMYAKLKEEDQIKENQTKQETIKTL